MGKGDDEEFSFGEEEEDSLHDLVDEDSFDSEDDFVQVKPKKEPKKAPKKTKREKSPKKKKVSPKTTKESKKAPVAQKPKPPKKKAESIKPTIPAVTFGVKSLEELQKSEVKPVPVPQPILIDDFEPEKPKPKPKPEPEPEPEPESYEEEVEAFEDEFEEEEEEEEEVKVKAKAKPTTKVTGKRKTSPTKKPAPKKVKTSSEPIKIASSVSAKPKTIKRSTGGGGVLLPSQGPKKRRFGLSKRASVTPLHSPKH